MPRDARFRYGGGWYAVTAAALVHVYTATGTLFGFAAVISVVGGDLASAFLWVAVATFVDYTDGTIARRLQTNVVIPFVNGRKLDALTDFLVNAFVPALLLWSAGALPQPVWLWLGSILLFSAYRYSRTYDPWTKRGLFRGLPVLWPFFTFYAVYLELPGWLAAAVILFMIALGCSNIRHIHVSRFGSWRSLNVVGLIYWWSIYILVVLEVLRPRPWVFASLVFPVSYLLTSWAVQLDSRKSRQLLDR